MADGDPNVDYLEPERVAKFVGMVYQPYYDKFGKDFGATIGGAFYDEPTLYRAQGRTWTERFNERFRRIWRTYLIGCAEMFRAANSMTGLFQITFAKGNRTPQTYPMSRAFLYEKVLDEPVRNVA